MSQATYIKEGRAIDYTPGADVDAGEVIVQDGWIGIATANIDSGDLGSLAVAGMFDVQQNDEIIVAGASVYWDEDGDSVSGTVGEGCATVTASANTYMGKAQALTAATDSDVRILLASAEVAAASVATATSITGTASTFPIAGLATTQGGSVSVTGGVSSSTGNNGGAVSSVGGVGGATSDGGAASVIGGASAAGATGTGGAVAITGGANANTTNGAGGAVAATGGAGKGSGAGGAASVTGGASAGSGAGGNVTLTPGASGSGIAGGVILRGDSFFAQDAPSAESTGAQAIAAADFVNGIVVHTVADASALSTPTGAEIAAVLPAGVTTGDAFRLHVITVGAGADDISTLTAGDGNVTFVGNVTVGPDDGTSNTNGYGTWIFRKTGATSFVGYRVG